MQKNPKDMWREGYRREQGDFWPWTLLVISVGIIFFHLGKIARSDKHFSKESDVMMAAPFLPITTFHSPPQLRPDPPVPIVKRSPAKALKNQPRKKTAKRKFVQGMRAKK